MENSPKKSLTVLPNSGRVERLRSEAAPTPAPERQSSGELEDRIIAALRTIYDPEIPVNIYELGLIYDINITPTKDVCVTMTLTAPGCPVAGQLVAEVHARRPASRVWRRRTCNWCGNRPGQRIACPKPLCSIWDYFKQRALAVAGGE